MGYIEQNCIYIFSPSLVNLGPVTFLRTLFFHSVVVGRLASFLFWLLWLRSCLLHYFGEGMQLQEILLLSRGLFLSSSPFGGTLGLANPSGEIATSHSLLTRELTRLLTGFKDNFGFLGLVYTFFFFYQLCVVVFVCLLSPQSFCREHFFVFTSKEMSNQHQICSLFPFCFNIEVCL